MTNNEWNTLLEVMDGKKLRPLPIGFIIDSPWLPNWNGITTLDYFSSEDHWFNSNVKAIVSFADIMFLPGFWSEFGMCSEPSAFGAKIIWDENNLPHAERVLMSVEQIDNVTKPNVEKDGLLPLIIKRLQHFEPQINDLGHTIKFAISRGPLNIASFLMGTSEFLMTLAIDPARAHRLLSIISDFIADWLAYQIRLFPTIEGIFLLDDIVGFLGDSDIKNFVMPYLKSIYSKFDLPVKFFHNDAEGKVFTPYLDEIGINLFNFSFQHSFSEIRDLGGNNVTLLGNIPPRDVLALGNKDDIKNSVVNSLKGVNDISRIIMSCGGGMPPNVPSKNIDAFVKSVKLHSS